MLERANHCLICRAPAGDDHHEECPTRAMGDEIVAGAVFDIEHPFLREKVSLPPDDPEATGMDEVMSWVPGVRYEFGDNAHGDDPDTVEEFDGKGAQILTVVAVFKPGRFPTRVFYTRKWRDPDGKVFGKGGLRIKIMPAFKRVIAGYRYQHPTRLRTSAEVVCGGTRKGGSRQLIPASAPNHPASASEPPPPKESQSQ